MRTVVSVTPLAIERDSRTLKQAASVTRLGYESVVVERYASQLDRRELPFTLRSLEGHVQDSAASVARSTPRKRGGSTLSRMVERLGQLVRRVPGVPYAIDRLYWCGLRTFLATPRAALYYLHAFYQFPAVQLRCWMHGVRFIYDAHDFYSDLNEGPGLSWIYRKLRVPFERWLEATCIRHAAAVVTVSEGVAALLRQKFGCLPVVVRNCEDRRLQRAPSLRLREAAGVAPTDFLFVVVGNAKLEQAIIALLDAMTMMPADIHVAFLGMGYEQLAARVRTLGLEARVHVIAPVKPYEVVPFIQSADASLFLYYPCSTNYLYCLPNKLFQSIAAGLPLLYPELPEVQKIAREHKLGLPINPLSPASIAAGMQAFVRQPNRLSAFRRSADSARDVLGWEHEEKVLAAILDQALCEPQEGTA